MKKVLVLREKHGNWYFDVSTDEQLHAVVLMIIEVRFLKKNDWYYGYAEVGERNKMQKAVDTKDGKLGLALLTARKGYEYEGFDIEAITERYEL